MLPFMSKYMNRSDSLLCEQWLTNIILYACLYKEWGMYFNLYAYLCEEGLVDLHTLVGALREDLAPAVPAVTHGRVGVGDTAQEHRALVVELLLGLADALVHSHHWRVQVYRAGSPKRTTEVRGQRAKFKGCLHSTVGDRSGDFRVHGLQL